MKFNSRLARLEKKHSSTLDKKLLLVVGGYATIDGKKVKADDLDMKKYSAVEYKRIDITLDTTVSPHLALAEEILL